MRPIPIDAYHRAQFPDTKLITVGAPRGKEDSIGSVEALQGESREHRCTVYAILIQFTEEEVERLRENGGLFWYTQLGEMVVPFSMELPPYPPDPSGREQVYRDGITG